MSDAIVNTITKAKGRKSLFHFTRARNLSAIAHLDALMSSYQINPHLVGERRLKPMDVNHGEHSITINAHLKISDRVIDEAITQEQFRACLDQYVFLWPTLKDCQKMMGTYARREPDERFTVLQFDAYALITAHYSALKLSKYDSGSSPRFPNHCSYKKSLAMFLPINSFKTVLNSLVPVKASEIREVLIEDRVSEVSTYLQAIYVDHCEDAPERWRELMRPLADLGNRSAAK